MRGGALVAGQSSSCFIRSELPPELVDVVVVPTELIVVVVVPTELIDVVVVPKEYKRSPKWLRVVSC